jgi:hypothetical protein
VGGAADWQEFRQRLNDGETDDLVDRHELAIVARRSPGRSAHTLCAASALVPTPGGLEFASCSHKNFGIEPAPPVSEEA